MDNSGLAIESAEFKGNSKAVSRTIGAVKITDVHILSEKNGEKIPGYTKGSGKAPGRYITLECEPHADGLTALLRRAVSQMLPASGRLFAVGLGNPDITADSLGASVIRGITARRGRRYTLSAIETDVASRTGLDTVKLIRAAARELRADCVIAIDALACHDPRCIGRTVQITDSGIVPGSGASEGASKTELSRRTLGIPAAAIGVPTMTLLSSVTGSKADKGFHVTAGDCDILIKMWSEIISGAIDAIVS